ncbi:AMP-binding enzyme protein [Rutstroemia sp. NJR-2017a BVV2]|nr:AMP-binding enzyme protein [Rutstroemia sp. NJR-2017a BVV2]
MKHSPLTHLSFHSARIMDLGYDFDFDFELDLALFGQTEQQHPGPLDDLPTSDMGSEKRAGHVLLCIRAQDAAQDTVLLGSQGINFPYFSHTHNILRSRQCHIHSYLYHETTCATCAAPLDLSEADLYIKDPHAFCTRSRAPDHLSFQCLPGCGLKFNTLKDLRQHSSENGHYVFCCPFPNCASRFSGGASTDVRDHVKTSHRDDTYTCAECGDENISRPQLDYHGSGHGHSAYICRYPNCDSTAAQFADLVRHQACHKKDVPRYPCPHCRSYRGNNGFKRKDHLQQHIRGYHKIEATVTHTGDIGTSPFCCRFTECKRWGVYHEQNLRSLEDLTEHMRAQHSSSAYICNKPSCERVGMNGFGTKKDLQVHVKKDHPSPFQCPHPGCGRVGSNGWLRERDMKKHVTKFHSISEE